MMNTNNIYLLAELFAIILIVVGIGMIYLPAAFICAGISMLALIYVKEEEADAIEKSS